ncbi:PAS domain-containing hybrid sensor histidine kinase/response regulator [Pseudobacteriovorax antillogorgiicola]|uniref:histidine kinase n=1 Tax=Pseudobacteriovorax antillogorgiicola TaxID=1513793 RepID=A0A1Y6BGQ9_9BACT|nr:ATP-binding protein [Pseudobacteriovorax antillogorgiicola]TCS56333.1 PAS domain S-box-containing protein [Pseudobacteriovorax antillogorgiicola]SMF06941.1 PAS domain S-box-containing protein [Pseudobacteriovorax antillogorgiicola]
MNFCTESLQKEIEATLIIYLCRFFCPVCLVFAAFFTIEFYPPLLSVALLGIITLGPGCSRTLVERFLGPLKIFTLAAYGCLLSAIAYFSGGTQSPAIPWVVIAIAVSPFLLSKQQTILHFSVHLVAQVTIEIVKPRELDPFFQGATILPTVHTLSVATCIAFAFALFYRFSQFVLQQTQQNRQLSSIQQNLLKVFDQAEDFIGMSDSHGRIIYHNRAFNKLVGVSQEDAQDMIIPQFHPQWASDLVVSEGIPEAIKNGSWTGETAIYNKDKNEVPVLQTIIAHVNHHGYPEYVSTIMKDITALKAREQDMERAKRFAEQAMVAKSQFLANMSHEIRTPMNGLLGNIELLSDMNLPEEASQRIKTIESSGQHLMRVLDDILDVSKIETGNLNLERISFNLPYLMNDVVSMFLDKAFQKNIDLNVTIAEQTPEWVYGDPTRLRQVLLNLISNSIKFTNEGGVSVTLSPGSSADYLDFVVEDTGAGIPIDQQENVFKSFHQGDNSTTRKFGGTGLGLAIAYKLVQAQGGVFALESQVGVGTRFSFTCHLPKSSAPEVASSKESSQLLADRKPLQILVAEDNEINTDLVRRYLDRLGYRADFASNGDVALKMCQQKNYDIVFMDCHMPIMDGFEATRKILALGNSPAPTIVALTASVMKEEQELAASCGMSGFLGKPLSKKRLQEFLIKFENYDQPKPSQAS